MVFTRPDIFVSESTWQQLSDLIERYSDRQLVAWLQSELDRAMVCLPEELPPDAIQLGSTVAFLLSTSDRVHHRQLVLPHLRQRDDQISVMSPVGSALLGLRIGDEIEWPLSSGQPISVHILDVDRDIDRVSHQPVPQPEQTV